MKQNMNVLDRSIRFVLSVLLGILYFSGGIEGVLATVLLIIASILFITAIIGFCPLYKLLHIHTKTEHE